MAWRILSLWQPHATLCVAPDPAHTLLGMTRPAKGIETRHWTVASRRLKLPLRIAIHATKRWDADTSRLVLSSPFREALTRCGYYAGDPRTLNAPDGLRRLPLGMIIAVATIIAVTPTADLKMLLEEAIARGGELGARAAEELAFGNYAPGRYGFVLDEVQPLPLGIPFTGRQDVLYLPDQAVTDAIAQQLDPSALSPVAFGALSRSQHRTVPPTTGGDG